MATRTATTDGLEPPFTPMSQQRTPQVAWFAHFPKTGGTAILKSLVQCTKVGYGLPCSSGLARGPHGMVIADFVGTGLFSSDEDAMCAVDHYPGLYGTMVNHTLQQPWYSRRLGVHFSCTDRVYWGAFSPRMNTTFCGTISHHLEHGMSPRIAQRIKQAGFDPVMIGSVRWPPAYYLSHYFYALRVQTYTSSSQSGGLRIFGPEHKVCIRDATSMACIRMFRRWLTELLSQPKPKSMAYRMATVYGHRLADARQWIFLETMHESLLTVLGNVMGAPPTAEVSMCLQALLNSSEDKVEPINNRKKQRLEPKIYFDAALLSLTAEVDRMIYSTFNYSTCVTCRQLPSVVSRTVTGGKRDLRESKSVKKLHSPSALHTSNRACHVPVSKSNKLLRKLVIYGERHTHTHTILHALTRQFLVRHVPLQYGSMNWWVGGSDDENRSRMSLKAAAEQSDAPAVVFVVSEPIQWARNMYSRPDHSPQPPGSSMLAFLRRPWRSYQESRSFQYPPREDFIESAPSLMKMRNIKLAQMLALKAELPCSAIVKAEEFLDRPFKVLSDLATTLNLEWREGRHGCKAGRHYCRDHRGGHDDVMMPKHGNMLDKFDSSNWLIKENPQVMSTLCQQLDLKIESQLGYLGPIWRACMPARWSHGPCSWVRVGAGVPASQTEDQCENLLRKHIERPTPLSACSEKRVPRIYHAVGKDPTPCDTVKMNAGHYLRGFQLNYHDDASARVYVRKHCGWEAEKAYGCFVAPAYRADLFRFCALTAQGGVYIDTDIALLAPVEEAVSLCDGATVGYDVNGAASGTDGLQMKILAAEPGHPLFRCMLQAIIENVRRRYQPHKNLPLLVTGPTLLNICATIVKQAHTSQGSLHNGIHITYRDTHAAMYPYTGLVRPGKILAFEMPSRDMYPLNIQDLKGKAPRWETQDMQASVQQRLQSKHYSELLGAGVLYSNESCRLTHVQDAHQGSGRKDSVAHEDEWKDVQRRVSKMLRVG